MQVISITATEKMLLFLRKIIKLNKLASRREAIEYLINYYNEKENEK